MPGEISDTARPMAAKKKLKKSPKVKPVAKKPVAKKPVAKKPVAKKPVAKKAVAKKPIAKKAVAKKAVAKKAVVKEAAPKKAAKRASVIQFQYANHLKRLPAASPAQIAAIEKHFGGALPADYAEFLRGVNGGEPVPSYALRSGFGFAVEAFYGAGAASYYDVLANSRDTSKQLGRPVVAIAGNGVGDQLLLLSPADPGVYRWIHDDGDPPVRMTKSFDDLLGSLCELDD